MTEVCTTDLITPATIISKMHSTKSINKKFPMYK